MLGKWYKAIVISNHNVYWDHHNARSLQCTSSQNCVHIYSVKQILCLDLQINILNFCIWELMI